MSRSKPLLDPKEEKKRLVRVRHLRRLRWEEEKPAGNSVRQLRRAIAYGYAPVVQVKNPGKYLNSHARQMAALKRVLAAR